MKHLTQSIVLWWRKYFQAACLGPVGPRGGSAGAYRPVSVDTPFL